MKTCPRCYHPMDEHDFQRCNHLAGTAERCRCWVANPARVVPRWYGPLVGVLLCVIAGLVLTGCGTVNRDGVQCLGAMMACDCVTSCEASVLTVPAAAVDLGSVVVTYEEGERCEPRCYPVRGCDGTMVEHCR